MICPRCGGPAGANLDCFAALGLEPRLVIDPDALERAYHDLSRRIHPDRFIGREPAVRDASLRGTALLTRSYRTLRDPSARGVYWLERNGGKLDEDNRRVPPELAELVFEVQEELAELRAAGAASAAGRELAQRAMNRRNEIAEIRQAALDDLARNFERWDAHADPPAVLTAELKAVLSRLAYLRTLLRDVDRELEGARAA